MAGKLRLLAAYAAARRCRSATAAQLAARREAGLIAARIPPLADLPLTTPAAYRDAFAESNVLGLSLAEARGLAQAELAGAPAAHPGYSFGLSTGTSGSPGVFLTTPAERDHWMGTILGRFLGWGELARASIGLLLRHGNALYGRLPRRLRHFPLTAPVEQWAPALCAFAPRILVGPPSALEALALSDAFRRRPWRPALLLAGGEPLFAADIALLTAAFGIAPRGVYQATEGFLAWGCPAGRLHWNDDLLAIEELPLAPGRFLPVVTDFTRRSQRFWRYQMDDVALAALGPCPCGSAFRSFLSIEGRLDDVLLLPTPTGAPIPLWPTDVQQLLPRPFSLTQTGPTSFTWATADTAPRDALLAALSAPGSPPPALTVIPYTPPPLGEKRRFTRRLFAPPAWPAR